MKRNLTKILMCGVLFAPSANAQGYIGVTTGITNLLGKVSVDATSAADMAQKTEQVFNTKANIGVFAGYGKRFGSFLIAGEAFAQHDKLSGRQEFYFFGAQAPQKLIRSSCAGAWGASLHLGLGGDHYAIYSILGTEHRRFKLSFEDSAVPPTIDASFKQKISRWSFVPGVGIRSSFCENMFARLEYKCSMYPGKKVEAKTQDSSIAVKFRPKIHAVSFGVGYVF